MIQVMQKTTHSLAIASAVSDSFQKDLNLAISICCDNLITWKKKTQNLTKMELYLMWYGTVGVYLEQNGINMEGWYQVGTFGRTNMEEMMPTNPGGSVVNFFEWGISREKTPRWLLSIRLNGDHFPAWKLKTYLCYVTIICISRSIYYSTLKKQVGACKIASVHMPSYLHFFKTMFYTLNTWSISI